MKLDDATLQKVAEDAYALWKTKLPNAEVMPVSALHKFNMDKVLGWIIVNLPDNPPFYSKDELTDKPEKFFVSEIIREKILLNYSQEVPYCTEVEVESFKDEETIVKIRAIIYVSRDSQKGIIIGNKGEALKRVGTQARKDIEAFLGKKVFLEMYVKVSKDWRNNENQLKKFGYDFS